jgi:hypothetical protein
MWRPLLFFALTIPFFVSCSSSNDSLAGQQEALSTIAKQHFSDLPISETLLPIVNYDSWLRRRGTSYIDARGIVRQALPPPPIDTILYNKALLDQLGKQGILNRREIQQLFSALNADPKVERLPFSSSDSLRVLPRIALLQPPNQAHYQLSVPLFTLDGRTALVSVQHYTATYKAVRYVFQLRQNRWDMVYRRIYEIE